MTNTKAEKITPPQERRTNAESAKNPIYEIDTPKKESEKEESEKNKFLRNPLIADFDKTTT